MVKEAPGQLNFTGFLGLFGEAMSGKERLDTTLLTKCPVHVLIYVYMAGVHLQTQPADIHRVNLPTNALTNMYTHRKGLPHPQLLLRTSTPTNVFSTSSLPNPHHFFLTRWLYAAPCP